MDRQKKEWHQEQVSEYDGVRWKYERYAEVLKEILQDACKALGATALVQSRAKTLESFAEKILRKYHKYKDPVNQLTDLCGARVVVYTQSEAAGICDFIKASFQLDDANSLDLGELLGTSKFGYRAVHYVVQLTRSELLGVKIPRKVRELKAEVQVCTMLQHVWSAIGHDRVYKSEVKVPPRLERALNAVAALLENADNQFAQTAEAIDAYLSDFDAYMSPQRLRDEMDKWRAVFALDPSNESTAHKIARLAMAAGDWNTADKVLTPFQDTEDLSVLRDLGRARCKTRRPRKILSGRKILSSVVKRDPHHANAHCDLGDSWREDPVRGEDLPQALSHYERAFHAAPAEPRILASHLECKLRVARKPDFAASARGSLEAAIAECRNRAELGVYLPEAHYNMGLFFLLLGQPYESLNAYAKAVQLSRTYSDIEPALESIGKIKSAVRPGTLPALAWVHGFLVVAAAGKALVLQRQEDLEARDDRRRPRQAAPAGARLLRSARLKRLGSKKPPRFERPVVIVAGGCDTRFESRLRSRYGRTVRQAFSEFSGTIISGGTTAGVSGMVAELAGPPRGRMRKIGYLPEERPRADRIDGRFKICKTPGDGYTPLGPIQTWADLLLAGIKPWEVRLLGINGGQLTAFEYRLALALGATVGIVESSGRAASEILPDVDWWDVGNLLRLPHDSQTLRAFVNPGKARLEEEDLEEAAKAIHANYVDGNKCNPKKTDPSMMPWECLREDYRNSNVQQAAYAAEILRAAGYAVEPVPEGQQIEPPDPKEFEKHVAKMAEMEHGRWNAERLMDGWRYGPQSDPQNKINPNIVPWADLPEEIREYDYRAVREFPDVLARARLRVVPLKARRGRGRSR